MIRSQMIKNLITGSNHCKADDIYEWYEQSIRIQTQKKFLYMEESMRLILILLFLVVFFIISIPLFLIEFIVGKI